MKQSSLQKKFGMGYVKIHGFHSNLLYDSRDWGVGLQIQSHLGFYLSQNTKIGVKLKFRHMSFFPVVRFVNHLICIFMNINENLQK